MHERPIGVFDSGVGGLSVARELLRALPGESLLYYADTAHVPYGGRPLDEVRGFALRICDFLAERGAKMIVMACNISSAVAIDSAQSRHPDIPIVGVVRPGARAAVRSGAERIGILATQGTVNSGAYERAIHEADKGIGVVQSACPKFVPLVEADQAQSREALDACREYLAPMARHPACDAVILGCTHYPFLAPMLRRAARELFGEGSEPSFIDPAGETARAVSDLLRARSLCAPSSAAVRHTYYASGDVEQFKSHAPLFLGAPVGTVLQA